MFLHLILLFGILIAFLMGYIFPKKMGWFLIGSLPILSGMPYLPLIPSSEFPLTPHRFAFVVTFGIVLGLHKRAYLLQILRNRVFKIVLLFIIVLFFASLRDIYYYHVIVNYFPMYIYPFFLCFYIITSEKDLIKLVKIFAWSSGIIGLLCIIEYITVFNITDALVAFFNPHFSMNEMGIEKAYRVGFFRIRGIEGSAVFTAARLSFLFPISIWYSFQNRVLGKLLLILTTIGLLLLQTKASVIAIVFSILIILFGLGKKATLRFLLASILPIAAVLSIPVLRELIQRFWNESFMTSIYALKYMEILDERSWSIPLGYHHILQNPLIGYGSPAAVYYILMHTGDLPAPMIYALSGGIFLGILYLAFLFLMPYSSFKLSINKELSEFQRELLIYITAAFIGGIVPLFFALAERHFVIMFMLYISIYKIFRKNARIPSPLGRGLVRESTPIKHNTASFLCRQP